MGVLYDRILWNGKLNVGISLINELTATQGIDISDIRVVIQWRATWCSLSTLWQRFGRAVRNMSLEGTAILFAEKEYFDVYKAEKEKRRVERAKRKATSSKKRRIENGPVAAMNIPTGEERSDGSDGSDDEIEISSTHVQQTHAGDTMDTWQLRAKMEVPRETNISQPRRKTSQQTGLEPAMDYFINADMRPGVGCRRKVLNVFFKNEEAGETYFIWLTSNSPG
jgi:superfamily II DNA/RNA helicase